jgi:monovalent cation/hydrogen antiporter
LALLELLLVLLLSAVALGWVARHFEFTCPIALVAGEGENLRACEEIPRTRASPVRGR